jgi:hypothetical protein
MPIRIYPYTSAYTYITILLGWFGLIMIRLRSKIWLLDTLTTPWLSPYYSLITASLHSSYTLILLYNSIAGIVRSDYDSTDIKDMAARHPYQILITPLWYPYYTLITASLHSYYTLILLYNSIAVMVLSDYDSTNIKDMVARTTLITSLLYPDYSFITPL